VLALVLTLILAVYILGPDLFFRFVVSLFAPAQVRTRNQSEEVARAVFLSILPVFCAWLLAHYAFHRFNNTAVLMDFLRGLYGEEKTAKADTFFSAAGTVLRLNLRYIVLPVYALVGLLALILGLTIINLGRLLRLFSLSSKTVKVLNWMVRPWVAEWHLKLSRTLLPADNYSIQVDVLTGLDVLYRGTLTDHQRGPDGSLVSITLTKPQKFKRQELLEARKKSKGGQLPPDPSDFWSAIKADFFVVMAGEIVSMNVTYVDPKALRGQPRWVSPSGAGRALAALNQRKAAASTAAKRTQATAPAGKRSASKPTRSGSRSRSLENSLRSCLILSPPHH